MESKISKMRMFFYVAQRGIQYNFVEFGFLVTFVAMEIILGGIFVPLLYVAGGLSVLWVLLSSTWDAEDECRLQLLEENIFVTDFAIGAAFNLALAVLTVTYGLSFGIVFLVAAIQNVRYTILSIDFLVERRRAERKE